MEPTGVEAQSPADLWSQLRSDWLILEGYAKVYKHGPWVEEVQERISQLEALPKSPSQPVLIAYSNPRRFLSALWAALLSNKSVALANPSWGLREWEAVYAAISPAVVWGEAAPKTRLAPDTSLSTSRSPQTLATSATAEPTTPTSTTASAPPHIFVPTGGSSGQIKFIPHTWQTLLASVSGFCQYFAPSTPINSFCVLPLYHVSGLMQVLRSALSGGQIAIAPFKPLESHRPNQPLPFHNSSFQKKSAMRVISLVPTQLHRLMQANQSPWLKQFDAVLLGGAPAWPALLDAAQAQQIPLSLSYGMTETAAMVTALKPESFLSGDRTSGPPLPHATIRVSSDDAPQHIEPQHTEPQHIGQISIQAQSIPAQLNAEHTLLTGDLGYFDKKGHLCITGRASQMIISGGENISPAEVEAAIRNTGLVRDVCVLGLPDADWGEAVIAAYVPSSDTVTARSLQDALRISATSQTLPTLSRYKHPKHWIPLAALPRNKQGKLNRQTLVAQVQTQLKSLSS